MLKEGYIDESRHAMLISVLNENVEKGSIQVDKLNSIIGQFFNNKQFKPIVLRQSVVSTNTVKDYAEKYNVSLGKMIFIKNLMILNPEFELEELVDLSIEELIKISRETGLDLRKIVDIDEDLLDDDMDEYEDDLDDDQDDHKEDDNNQVVKDRQVKKHISIDEAKAIALSLANGKITDLDLDEDDGRLIYEIEIDAYTGKVIEHDIDDDLDDDDWRDNDRYGD